MVKSNSIRHRIIRLLILVANKILKFLSSALVSFFSFVLGENRLHRTNILHESSKVFLEREILNLRILFDKKKRWTYPHFCSLLKNCSENELRSNVMIIAQTPGSKFSFRTMKACVLFLIFPGYSTVSH